MDNAGNKNTQNVRNIALTVLTVAMFLIFNNITGHTFLTQRNLTMLFKQSAVLMILASSLMILLIEKNIDLSGGAGVYLTGVIVALLILKGGVPIALAIPIALLSGILMGMINGFFIGYLELPAFIVTLAAQLIFRGIGYVLTGAATVGPMPKEFTNISELNLSPSLTLVMIIAALLVYSGNELRKHKKSKEWYGGTKKLIKKMIIAVALAGVMAWIFCGYKGMPSAVLIALAIMVIMHFVTSNTIFGRHAYLIGGNVESAKLAGVRVHRRVFQTYILEGIMYGIAGILLAARLGGAAATGGNLLELDAVAAACIGGTSMSGGSGTVFGVLGGVLVLTAIDNVMSLMNVSSYLQMVIKGIILLCAVCLDMYMNKAKFRFKLTNKS